MNKLLIRAALAILAVAADIAIPQIRFAAPDFLFLLVVFYAFREDSQAYLGFAVIGGLMLDAYASSAFGSYVLGLLMIGVLIRVATATLFRSEPRSFAYMAVAIVASNILLIGFLYLYSALASHWESGLHRLSPLYITHSAWLAILLNLVFALPLYFIVESTEQFIARHNRPRNQIR